MISYVITKQLINHINNNTFVCVCGGVFNYIKPIIIIMFFQERLSTEIRKLEVSRQEYMEQIQTLNQALARSHMEQARMIRQQTLMNQELELLKAVHETWADNDNVQKSFSNIDEKSEVVASSAIQLHQHVHNNKTENDINLYTGRNIQRQRQQQSHPTIEEVDIEDGNNDDASSHKSNSFRKISHEYIRDINRKHQSAAPSISNNFGSLKKECVGRRRSRTWSYKDLPSISNLEKLACQQQEQQQQQEVNELRDHGSNEVGHHGFPLPPKSSNVALSRSVSAKPMISSSRYKQKDIVITGSWMWKFTRNKATAGLSTERRHLRFIWLEPSINTLFWKDRNKMECPKSGTYIYICLQFSFINIVEQNSYNDLCEQYFYSTYPIFYC